MTRNSLNFVSGRESAIGAEDSGRTNEAVTLETNLEFHDMWFADRKYQIVKVKDHKTQHFGF